MAWDWKDIVAGTEMDPAHTPHLHRTLREENPAKPRSQHYAKRRRAAQKRERLARKTMYRVSKRK